MEHKSRINQDLISGFDPLAIEHLSASAKRDHIVESLPPQGFLAPRVAASLMLWGECLAVVLLALFQLSQYPGFALAQPLSLYLSVIAIVAVLYPTLLRIAGLYTLTALVNPARQIARITAVWFALMAVVAVSLFVFKLGSSLSRAWFLAWAFFGLGWALTIRVAIAGFVRKLNADGRFNRRAVLVGGGEAADHVISTLEQSNDTGVSLLGIFDDRGGERAPHSIRGVHHLGTLEDLINFVRQTRIDTLIVTLPLIAEDRLLQIVNRLWVLPVDIRLSAQGQKLRYRPRAYSYIGNLALLDVFDRPLGDWGPMLKTIEDKVIAVFALILLSPVFLAVAIAVKFDSKGPVFFRQKRYGFNNELIEVWKFRSMFTDQSDVDARKLVTKDDHRVTRVGRFIRKTSLDELPQIFNVLKGDLSLVGPRPHATRASAAGSLYENVVGNYFARHKVKPGMTGWAQINGWRGETDTAEKIERRVEFDLHYIENWSLTFDLYILARTPWVLLRGENAY